MAPTPTRASLQKSRRTSRMCIQMTCGKRRNWEQGRSSLLFVQLCLDRSIETSDGFTSFMHRNTCCATPCMQPSSYSVQRWKFPSLSEHTTDPSFDEEHLCQGMSCHCKIGKIASLIGPLSASQTKLLQDIRNARV